ncbi:uncharacterized protein [Atheta coriaria]|uniref:uncharacterized protein n=1 Tax=Dalotia coriaria TaxID=877792 RepID=UPI0031F349BC
MTEIENFVLPLHPTQRKPMSHFTMWDNHEERLSNLQEVHLPSDGVTPLTIDDESQQPDMPIKKSIGCDLCGIRVTSYNVLKRHLEGRRHIMRAGREGKTFECELCKLTANSQSQLDAHMKSVKHRNRVFKKEHGYDPSNKGLWVILFCVGCIFLNFLLLFKLML